MNRPHSPNIFLRLHQALNSLHDDVVRVTAARWLPLLNIIMIRVAFASRAARVLLAVEILIQFVHNPLHSRIVVLPVVADNLLDQ